MKLQWQWPGVVVFTVVFVTLGVLVWHGRVPADLLGILIAWLVPSPMAHRPTPALEVLSGPDAPSVH